MMIERGDGDRHLFSVADRENYSGVTAKWLQTRDPKQQNTQLGINRQPGGSRQKDYSTRMPLHR